MTISDEQLSADRAMVSRAEIIEGMSDVELAERNYDAQWKPKEMLQTYKTALAVLPLYISEVEQLRNSLKTNSQIQQNFFNEAIKQRDDALAETKRLRAELEKYYDLSKAKNEKLLTLCDMLESQRVSNNNEIHRLQCELQWWPEKLAKNAIEVGNESKEQVTKLWEEKTALQREIEVTTLALSERDAENEFLESENERLRAELEKHKEGK